MKYINKL